MAQRRRDNKGRILKDGFYNQNHPLNGWFALALQGHITDLCLKAR